MKISLLLIALFLTNISLAQDKIYFKNGDVLGDIKIKDFSFQSITYYELSNPTKLLELSQQSVYLVERKRIFNTFHVSGVHVGIPKRHIRNIDFNDLCFRGTVDGYRHYSNTNAYYGTMLPTVVFPPAGIVTGAIVSSINPKNSSLAIPSDKLADQPEYFQCYKKSAKRIKANNTWIGFGKGVAYSIALYSLFYIISVSGT